MHVFPQALPTEQTLQQVRARGKREGVTPSDRKNLFSTCGAVNGIANEVFGVTGAGSERTAEVSETKATRQARVRNIILLSSVSRVGTVLSFVMISCSSDVGVAATTVTVYIRRMRVTRAEDEVR